MISFKRHTTRDTIKKAVDQYFSKSEKDQKSGKSTLKNLAQSPKHKDDVADIMLDYGANAGDFSSIGLTEEVGMSSSAPGTTTANLPDPLEIFQGGTSGIMKRVDEEYDDTFLGRPVFNVSESTYSNFLSGKNRYHRWSKYINMNGDSHIYEYAKKNPKKSIILRNTIGAMINVKPEQHMH